MVKLTPSTARVGVFVFRIFHGTFLDKHRPVSNQREQRQKTARQTLDARTERCIELGGLTR